MAQAQTKQASFFCPPSLPPSLSPPPSISLSLTHTLGSVYDRCSRAWVWKPSCRELAVGKVGPSLEEGVVCNLARPQCGWAKWQLD